MTSQALAISNLSFTSTALASPTKSWGLIPPLGNIEAYAAGAARNVVTAVTPASPSPGGPT